MATTVIVGDVAEGQIWWGTAEFLKQQLAQGYRMNNAYMHTWKQVSVDTSIFCEMRAGTPWAFIFTTSGLYLESGFYNFDSFPGQLTVPLGTTATCKYNTLMDSISLLENQHFDQRRVTIDAKTTVPEEILTGQDLTPSEIALYDGFRSRSVNRSAANTDEAWLDKFTAMHWCPASCFTGKLKLLVQALYGREKFDVSYVGNTGDIDIPAIKWGDVVLGINKHASINAFSSLLTTSDYDYFLVNDTNSQLKFYKLRFSTQAARLISIIKLMRQTYPASTPDAQNFMLRLEAYAFAGVETIKESDLYATVDYTANAGQCLYYGYHYNFDGTVGEIVQHEDVVDHDASTYYMLANHCRMTIDYTQDAEGEYIFTAVEELLEQKAWDRDRALGVSIDVPFPDGYKMTDVMYTRFLLYGYGTPLSGDLVDIPVYCYRDPLDDIVVVTVSDNVVNTTATQTGTAADIWAGQNDNRDGWSKSGLNGSVSITAGSETVGGDYIETSAETYNNYTFSNWGSPQWTYNASTGTWHEYNCQSGGHIDDFMLSTGRYYENAFHFVYELGYGTGEYYSHSCYSGGPTWNDQYYYVAGFAAASYAYTWTQYPSGRLQTYKAIMSIPWYAADAVILAGQLFQNAYSRKRYTTTFDFPGSLWEGKSYPDSCASYSYPNPPPIITGRTSGGEAGFTINYYSNWGGATTDNFPTAYTNTCIVVGCFGKTTAVNGSTQLYGYFDVSGADPYVYNMDVVKYGFSEGYKYDTAYTGYSDEIEFPGSAVVGWA